jgi:hypothetical protein
MPKAQNLADNISPTDDKFLGVNILSGSPEVYNLMIMTF